MSTSCRTTRSDGWADNSKCGLTKKIWIGFSEDGVEIVATYTSRKEVREFRQPGEIVTGPWMRMKTVKKKVKKAERRAKKGGRGR